ncbi:hypothetical protein HMPREF3231_01878 [Bifidobacterium longum]|nr:hypothetical protein HMPREF3231_01878 [Bifidobacterium longum]
MSAAPKQNVDNDNKQRYCCHRQQKYCRRLIVEGLSQIKDKRTEPLLEKLKEQGWRIEAKKKGWMCYPPDKSKPGVVFRQINLRVVTS